MLWIKWAHFGLLSCTGHTTMWYYILKPDNIFRLFYFYSKMLAFQFVLKYNKSAFCILSATHWLNASHRVDFLYLSAIPSTLISLCELTWTILIIFYVNCKRPRPSGNRSNRNIFGLINWKLCGNCRDGSGNRCGNGHRSCWFRASLNAKSNVKGITIRWVGGNCKFSLFSTWP